MTRELEGKAATGLQPLPTKGTGALEGDGQAKSRSGFPETKIQTNAEN